MIAKNPAYTTASGMNFEAMAMTCTDRFAENSSGVGAAEVVRTVLADIFMEEGFADHQSPRYGAKQITDNAPQYNS